MGVVVAAYDEQLDRRIAIKLVRASAGQPDERVLQEARSLARLSHPNVVQIYDVGTHDGQIFVAMEYVQGETLRLWLETRRSWRDVVDAFVQAGRGLAAAHAQEIVHRDFKPDNVMIDERGRVRVLDFGLARHQGGSGSTARRSLSSDAEAAEDDADPRVTRPGVVMGTPAYMSPEQRAGAPVGPASDQFSYCVALHEALHGERPRIPGVPGSDEKPARRSTVPTRVDAVVERGLLLDPDKRWPSMEALLYALARARRRRRHRWTVGLVGATATGIFGYAVAKAPTMRPECEGHRQLAGVWNDDARDELRDAFVGGPVEGSDESASAKRDTAERVVARIDAYTTAWDDTAQAQCEADQRGELSAQLRERSAACLRRLRLRLMQRVLAIKTRPDNAWTHAIAAVPAPMEITRCADPLALQTGASAGDPEQNPNAEALELALFGAEAQTVFGEFAVALKAARAVAQEADASGLQRLRAEASLLVATTLLELGDPTASETAAAVAVTTGEALGDDLLTARALVARAYGVGYHQAQHDEGLRWAELATAKIRRLGTGDDAVGAELESVKGAIHASRGEFVLAQQAFGRSEKLWERVDGLASARGASTLDSLGHMAARQKHADEAEVYYRRALGVREEVLGPHHPDLALSLLALGNLYDDLGDPERATATFVQALELQEASLGADHPDVAVTHNSLGVSAMQQEDWPRARSRLQRAIEIFEQGPPEHPRLAFARLNAASTAQALGDDAGARSHLRRVIAAAEHSGDSNGPLTANALVALGRLELSADDCDKAQPLLERGLALREATDATPERLARARIDLASALWNRSCGRVKADPRARALAQRALDAYALLGVPYAADHERVRQWLIDHPSQ